MAIEKNDNFESYEFKELSGLQVNEFNKIKSFDVETFNLNKDFSQEQLLSELKTANSNNFEINQDVLNFRKISEAKKNEMDKLIHERVAAQINEIKDKAFEEGYQKGVELGKEEAKKDEAQGIMDSIENVKLMVNNLMNREADLFQAQIKDLYALIRNLVKWITLKDLDKDDQYLQRLVDKIIESNRQSNKIHFHVGIGITSTFKDSIEQINTSLATIYGDRVEIKENLTLPKDAIEVELDNSILKADLNEQLSILDKLFHDHIGENKHES